MKTPNKIMKKRTRKPKSVTFRIPLDIEKRRRFDGVKKALTILSRNMKRRFRTLTKQNHEQWTAHRMTIILNGKRLKTRRNNHKSIKGKIQVPLRTDSILEGNLINLWHEPTFLGMKHRVCRAFLEVTKDKKTKEMRRLVKCSRTIALRADKMEKIYLYPNEDEANTYQFIKECKKSIKSGDVDLVLDPYLPYDEQMSKALTSRKSDSRPPSLLAVDEIHKRYFQSQIDESKNYKQTKIENYFKPRKYNSSNIIKDN